MNKYNFSQDELTVMAVWSRTQFEINTGSYNDALEKVKSLEKTIWQDYDGITIIDSEHVHNELYATIALKFYDDSGKLLLDIRQSEKRDSLILELASELAEKEILETRCLSYEDLFDEVNKENYKDHIQDIFIELHEKYQDMLEMVCKILSDKKI